MQTSDLSVLSYTSLNFIILSIKYPIILQFYYALKFLKLSILKLMTENPLDNNQIKRQ